MPHASTPRVALYLLLAFALGGAAGAGGMALRGPPQSAPASGPSANYAIVISIGERDAWISTGGEGGAQVARFSCTTAEKARAKYGEAIDAMNGLPR